MRFLDPCQPEDDHDFHWRILSDGQLEPLTTAGEYTIERLKLWHPFLQHHRAKTLQLQEEVHALIHRLSLKSLSTTQRLLLERRLNDIREWLEPLVFDRPRL